MPTRPDTHHIATNRDRRRTNGHPRTKGGEYGTRRNKAGGEQGTRRGKCGTRGNEAMRCERGTRSQPLADDNDNDGPTTTTTTGMYGTYNNGCVWYVQRWV
ncbi:hypothetical protein CVT25_011603 [Psilocybe cyanescens]|uniref:Uncharacterized protein n=1 Tax=Psilocybe cyanescens TaxID=93625 RepID=A0A409XK34_PSICY|nr:hypothetical protein CVT25_011603 [Psilocybe cyanescens]